MDPKLGPLLFVACLGAALAPWACASGPAMTVVRSEPGQKPEPVVGDNVRVARPTTVEHAGMKPGYHAIRSMEQWRALWPGGEKPLPAHVELGQKMILAASSDAAEVVEVKVLRVMDTANTLHVFTKEARLGKDCVRKDKEKGALDFVVADHIAKPVKVYVEVVEQPSCGAPPKAEVKCRVGNQAEWMPRVQARPGNTIECEARIEATGVFPIVDRTWHFASVPGGSSARMAFAKDGLKISFEPDLFGDYKVSFEVVDEAHRRGEGVVTAEVLPPNERDVFVQLAWAGFDSSDDVNAFPRAQLRAYDDVEAPKKGPKRLGKECSTTSKDKPEWCDVSTKAPITHLHVKGSDKGGRYVLSVHYTDERVDGGPYLCVRSFVGGKLAQEACDKRKRDVGSDWSLGVLEGPTGTIDDGTPKPVVDGGAGEGGAGVAVVDAGPPPPPSTTSDPAGLAKKRRQE